MRQTTAFLTLREIKAFFHQVKNLRDYALFYLCYHHGFRVSEVLELTIKDLDITRGVIFCHRLKGSISGMQVMSPEEVDVVLGYLGLRKVGGGFLFPGRSAGHLSRKTVDKMFKKYASRARIPVSKRHTHILKHSIAVHMLEAGADIKLVQELLGHRRIQNTLIYAQLVSKYRNERQLEMFQSKKVF